MVENTSHSWTMPQLRYLVASQSLQRAGFNPRPVQLDYYRGADKSLQYNVYPNARRIKFKVTPKNNKSTKKNILLLPYFSIDNARVIYTKKV